ncbi:MAG: type transport system ATP-binding protein [Actinomycetota bacterium]|jgi:ABC-2 type transport system ATP-binding protein|nr:type transport system ATP-binding protein [Actinomycetota bacterium]
MSELAIDVRGLKKSYGSFEAVKGVDLQVQVGEIFSLLGPNGAGKTTTVEILEGHRTRSAGEISVLGHDPGKSEKAYKERIGIVLQETGVNPYLTVAETIDQFRSYYPHPRPRDEILEVIGLQDKADARVKKLSGGQQRRLDVGVGLAGDPELLFLDEPTTGFDPSARRNAWSMITHLKELGKTVLLTTHYMDEAQNLADRVAIIVAGRIVAEGAPYSLMAERGGDTRVTFALPSGAPALPSDLGHDESGDRIVMSTAEPMRLLNRLTGWAIDNGVELEELSVARPSLEDIYLELTKDAEVNSA